MAARTLPGHMSESAGPAGRTGSFRFDSMDGRFEPDGPAGLRRREWFVAPGALPIKCFLLILQSSVQYVNFEETAWPRNACASGQRVGKRMLIGFG
jgi:hypothetical protein